MVPWFSSLGYVFDSDQHGVASDWALDLVAVGFAKPRQYYGHTMCTRDELLEASAAFIKQYQQQPDWQQQPGWQQQGKQGKVGAS